jgi:phosphopantothenoylcysteine synthetase/decarboxylase
MAHQIQSNKKNVLIGCSGSVACIKVPDIINELKAKDPLLNVRKIHIKF